jgi:hypothetical protein
LCYAGGFETDEAASIRTQLLRLGLLDDAVDNVALRRVEDPAVAEPERDVRRLATLTFVVRDEVAGPRVLLVDRLARLLLLIGVPRDDPPARRWAMWTRPEQSIPRFVTPPQRYGVPRNARAWLTGSGSAAATSTSWTQPG